jgi:hypothetical protein
VARQALAGMLWSKQYFGYDVEAWLARHGRDPLAAGPIRNGTWNHLIADDVISMPDAWEYPWFAAWDLAFHTVAFSLIDLAFAKRQLDLLLSRRYLHPNGQIPGVRVELRRREPARARLGHLPGLRAGQGAARPR